MSTPATVQIETINLGIESAPIALELGYGIGAQGIQGEQGIQGPQGIQGIQGEQGPQGDPGVAGVDGDSAYQVWLAQGNVGTEQDFLDSLVGPQGPQGIQGIQGPQGEQGIQGPPGSDATDALTLNGQPGSYYLDLANSTGAIATSTGVADAGKVVATNASGLIDATLLGDIGGDADTLNGQPGSYYLNASNLNAGTVPNDRLPSAVKSWAIAEIDAQKGSVKPTTRQDGSALVVGDRWIGQFGSKHFQHYWNGGTWRLEPALGLIRNVISAQNPTFATTGTISVTALQTIGRRVTGSASTAGAATVRLNSYTQQLGQWIGGLTTANQSIFARGFLSFEYPFEITFHCAPNPIGLLRLYVCNDVVAAATTPGVDLQGQGIGIKIDLAARTQELQIHTGSALITSAGTYTNWISNTNAQHFLKVACCWDGINTLNIFVNGEFQGSLTQAIPSGLAQGVNGLISYQQRATDLANFFDIFGMSALMIEDFA